VSAKRDEATEVTLQKNLAWDNYLAMKDGGDTSLKGCPERLKETYIIPKERCLNFGCGFNLKG
jgi:hypothetical protein